MKFIRKWYNRYCLTKDTKKISDVDELSTGILSFETDDHKVDYLEKNYEYYEKFGKNKLATMVKILRDQIEDSNLTEKETDVLRGSLLAYRTMMRSFEVMPDQIINLKSKGDEIQEKIININNFDE